MSKKRLLLNVLSALVLLLTCGPLAHAQAIRTWVSRVGDDSNPCSLTAPCRTFAGAISKTAAGGEINVLDSGNFGAVTITKSITISSEEFEAGVRVSGTDGIVVDAAPTDVVVLRGLRIKGLGTGLDGIKVLGGPAALHVEKCIISGFRGANGSGIEIAPTMAGTTQVFIQDTIIRNNGQGTGGGIFINPTGGAIVKASLDNVRMEFNIFGLKVQGSTTAMVNGSVAAGNWAGGFTNAAPAVLFLARSVAANNGTFGVVCQGTTISLGDTTIVGNGTAATTGTCQP
jgi:hypothetical protein